MTSFHPIIEGLFKRSSFCGTSACVEVAALPGSVMVRDRTGNVLGFTDQEWVAFIEGVKAGEFDL